PEAQRRDGGRIALVRAPFGELEKGVGEVVPEERLRVLEGMREVELLERRGHALDQYGQAMREGAVELGADRPLGRRLREHELARVEELGDQALPDLEHLRVEGPVAAEPRAR